MRQSKQWRIAFWNPGHRPAERDGLFGCATLGFFDGERWAGPDSPETAVWRTIRGRAAGGTFEELLGFVRQSEMPPRAVLVFLTGNAGNDAFVRSLEGLLPGVPILDGAAAQHGGNPGQVLPDGKDGAILLIDEDGFGIEGRAVHVDPGEPVAVLDGDARRLLKLRAGGVEMPALRYYNRLREKLGRPSWDFESVTFQTPEGKNIHCSAGEGDVLFAGSDIDGKTLRTVAIERGAAQGAISTFMCREGALSVGCAGLKSLLTEPVTGKSGNVGVFLFGEIVPVRSGNTRFANLMLGSIAPV